MTLLKDIEELFGTKDLYRVLNVDRTAKYDEIKKGYRRTSLMVHPDRVEESQKEVATKRFQALAQVHYILSDENRRQLYDKEGILDVEDDADWSEYWRALFPKISEKDIQDFLNKYTGSEEEEKDLIELYTRYEGNLDKINENMIGYDEERTSELLKRLIKDEKVPNYSCFSDEPLMKKRRRQARAKREAKEADEMKEEMKRSGRSLESADDLTALIKIRKQNFDSMIANIEAKYTKKKTRKHE